MTGGGPAGRCRIEHGAGFRLRDHDPADAGGDQGAPDKAAGASRLADAVHRLSALQERLFAQGRWSLLCVFQAMDAGGKDGTIGHVLSGVNPAGVRVVSFKAPGPEELARDFLWRVHAQVPRRGEIGVFNRSHYEEVLAVRVHPELLERQRLPDAVTGADLWRGRLEDIAAFEAYLARQGVAILKFFLHVSRKEQRRRLLARLDDPDKLWKFDADDLAQRKLWDQYQDAYEAAIAATSAPHAPWFVVPADHKWFARLVVAEAMVAALDALDLTLPPPDDARRAMLDHARQALRED